MLGFSSANTGSDKPVNPRTSSGQNKGLLRLYNVRRSIFLSPGASVLDIACLIAALAFGLALVLATFWVALLIGSPAIHFGFTGILAGVLSRVSRIAALLGLLCGNTGSGYEQ
jgi:uncharacterized membrane protein